MYIFYFKRQQPEVCSPAPLLAFSLGHHIPFCAFSPGAQIELGSTLNANHVLARHPDDIRDFPLSKHPWTSPWVGLWSKRLLFPRPPGSCSLVCFLKSSVFPCAHEHLWFTVLIGSVWCPERSFAGLISVWIFLKVCKFKIGYIQNGICGPLLKHQFRERENTKWASNLEH